MHQGINLAPNFKDQLKEVFKLNNNLLDNNNLCHLQTKVLEYLLDLIQNHSHSQDMVISEWAEVLATILKEDLATNLKEALAINLKEDSEIKPKEDLEINPKEDLVTLLKEVLAIKLKEALVILHKAVLVINHIKALEPRLKVGLVANLKVLVTNHKALEHKETLVVKIKVDLEQHRVVIKLLKMVLEI